MSQVWTSNSLHAMALNPHGSVMPELCQERASGGASRMTAASTEMCASRLSRSPSTSSLGSTSRHTASRRVDRLARCAAYQSCVLIKWRSVSSQFQSRSGTGACQARPRSGRRNPSTRSRVARTSSAVTVSVLSASRDGVDDLLVEAGERRQVCAPLCLESFDQPAVLLRAALALIELSGLQDLRVVDAGKG